MEDYFQYLIAVDEPGNSGANEADAAIGGPPFGVGLQRWLESSPGFNLDKVHAPVLITALGRPSLLLMWGAYAGLRYLHRPVDLVLLKSEEHVLTNPEARLASQGGTVDWFRFWLQGYEDHSGAKSEQYMRWRALRKLTDTKSTAVH
jgi:hypothetical protein